MKNIKNYKTFIVMNFVPLEFKIYKIEFLIKSLLFINIRYVLILNKSNFKNIYL